MNNLQATDLRIGNWVQLPPLSIPRLQINHNGWMKITGYGISILESDVSNKLNWSGIPLTKELLLKIGFKDDTYSNFTLELNDEYNEQNITIHFSDYECLNYNGVRFSDQDLMGECVYLHELQNLFYVLTKKELEVDL